MSTVLDNRFGDPKVSKKSNISFKLLRSLRLCLKYRPEIYKLILKMRQCIRRKNTILTRLKKRMKVFSSNTKVNSSCAQTDITNIEIINEKTECASNRFKKSLSEASTQTEKLQNQDKLVDQEKISDENVNTSVAFVWKTPKEEGDQEKSIAEQVEEIAQSALNESGMVYVESAGMYYDYKTGYYYNSELGLYYHTETGCYYYYSHEKKNFVFHSYPDRSAEIANASLIKHVTRKAKKHKKEMKYDIDNLTENFSQGKEESNTEDSSKAKRKKGLKSKRNTKKLAKNNISETEVSDLEQNLDSAQKGTICFKTENENSIKKNHKELMIEDDELEDGECSETDSDEERCEEDEDLKSNISTSTVTDDESVATNYPPCIRMIVRETNVEKLKVGSLFVITKDGGSIGREGDHHAFVIKDNNISRNHLDIRYNLEREIYQATDLGSKNGTILNGLRMSESQDVSASKEIIHGSVIQMGETKLLCHIHPGNETCGHCEPGILMEADEKERKVAYTRTCSVQKQHQLELARLKNKYSKAPLAIEAEAYNDRAQARRDTVGSSHHAEKTQSSDLDTFITPENKGFKILEKMGWSKGEGLGKDNQGDKEPIPLVGNDGKSGLGTSGSAPSYHVPTSNLGPATLRLASRTKMLQPPAKAFLDPLNYNSD